MKGHVGNRKGRVCVLVFLKTKKPFKTICHNECTRIELNIKIALYKDNIQNKQGISFFNGFLEASLVVSLI